jgi:hypothetical protein
MPEARGVPDARLRPAGEGICRIRPAGVRIAVSCEPTLLSAVERQLAPWIHDRPVEAADVCVRISGAPTGSPAHQYELRDARGVLLVAAGPDDLLAGLQNWLDREVAQRAAHVTAVHAGVVAWGERAILLPAPSGAGKTTLVAALLERGASYYSDELALLDPSGRVHPYPRHLMVRDHLGRGRATPPEAFGARTGTAALRVSLILDLRFEQDSGFRLDRLPASEAVLLLLANTAHRLSSAHAVPPALLSATAQALSYRGRRGDAQDTADAILRLVERTAE